MFIKLKSSETGIFSSLHLAIQWFSNYTTERFTLLQHIISVLLRRRSYSKYATAMPKYVWAKIGPDIIACLCKNYI